MMGGYDVTVTFLVRGTVLAADVPGELSVNREGRHHWGNDLYVPHLPLPPGAYTPDSLMQTMEVQVSCNGCTVGGHGVLARYKPGAGGLSGVGVAWNPAEQDLPTFQRLLALD